MTRSLMLELLTTREMRRLNFHQRTKWAVDFKNAIDDDECSSFNTQVNIKEEW